MGLALFTFSEPAKSTNEILDVDFYWESKFTVCTMSEKIKCDLDEESFISVAPVFLWDTPSLYT